MRWQKITIGSNVVVGALGVIIADGKRLVTLERDEDTGRLLLHANVYDASQQRLGKLRRNAWVFNRAGYQINTNPKWLELASSDGETLFKADVVKEDELVVSEARLFTPLGLEVVVTPGGIRVGDGVTLSGNTQVGGGAFLVIDGSGLQFATAVMPPTDD